jgi:hypothetical protein
MINILIYCFTWINRNQRPPLNECVRKVNISSGMHTVDGWINIDISLNALFASLPRPILRILYYFLEQKAHIHPVSKLIS